MKDYSKSIKKSIKRIDASRKKEIDEAIALLKSNYGAPCSHFVLGVEYDDSLWSRMLEATEELSKHLFTQEKPRLDRITCAEIEKIARDFSFSFFSHVGADIPPVTYFLVSTGSVNDTKEAGRYSIDSSGKSTITININHNYNADTILAIIAHECVHHILLNKGINRKDENNNELLTDVAMVFFGLWSLPLGYHSYTGYEYDSSIKMKEFTYRIGYLTDEELAYIVDGRCMKEWNKWKTENQKSIKSKAKTLQGLLEKNRKAFSNSLSASPKEELNNGDYQSLSKNAFDFNNKEGESLLNLAQNFVIQDSTRNKDVYDLEKRIDDAIEEYSNYNKVLAKF